MIHKIVRHVDAGYEKAIDFAEKNDVKIPMLDSHLAALVIEHGATLATTDSDFQKFSMLKTVNPWTFSPLSKIWAKIIQLSFN